MQDKQKNEGCGALDGPGDGLRERVKALEKERDKALARVGELLEHCSEVGHKIGPLRRELLGRVAEVSTLKAERDEARAEVQRLKSCDEEPRCNHWSGQTRCQVCGMGYEAEEASDE